MCEGTFLILVGVRIVAGIASKEGVAEPEGRKPLGPELREREELRALLFARVSLRLGVWVGVFGMGLVVTISRGTLGVVVLLLLARFVFVVVVVVATVVEARRGTMGVIAIHEFV